MKTIARSALALAPDNDGRIVVGGQFTTLGGVPRRRFAQLNTGLNADESFRGDGFDDEAHPFADRTRDAGSRRTRSERRRHTRPQQPVAPVDNGWSGANPLVPPRLSVDRTTPEASGIDRVEVSDTTGTTRSLQVQVQINEPLTGREAELRYGRSATAAAGTDTRHPLCRDLDAPLGERLLG